MIECHGSSDSKILSIKNFNWLLIKISLGGINPFMIENNEGINQQPQSPTISNFNPFVAQQPTQCNFIYLFLNKLKF